MEQREKLEKFKYLIEMYITSDEFESIMDNAEVNVSQMASFLNDNLRVDIRGCIWGEDLDAIEIKTPATWWDHFKESCFPEFAKNRWPVRYKTQTITTRAVYPKLSFPHEPHAIHIVRREGE